MEEPYIRLRQFHGFVMKQKETEMSTLLVLDTSPRRDAASRQLTENFVTAWSEKHPDGRIIHRDVGANPPEHLVDELIEALRKQPETLTQRQIAARESSDSMIAEIMQADAVVIGAPMHNFTVSGALKGWLDHIARPSKTFGYDPEKGPVGLLEDKPVYVISTRGGDYGDGDPDNPHPADFQTGYLRFVLGFVGLKDVHVIAANGLDMGDEKRAEGLKKANEKIGSITAAA